MGRKLGSAEAQQLGLEGGSSGRRVSEEEVGQLGLESESASGSAEPEGFELPYPEVPMEGLALDPQTRQPSGSTFGTVNPLKATALGFGRGLTAEFLDEGGAKVDSLLGRDEETELKRTRNDMAANEAGYPILTGVAKFGGNVAGLTTAGAATGLAKVGQAAKGLAGVGKRVLASGVLGSLWGGAEGTGEAEGKWDSPEATEARQRGMVGGGVAGAAGQALIGEPVRALGGALANRIGSVDEGVARSANEAIASAEGRAGKQAGEAVGGARNIRLEMLMEKMGIGGKSVPPPAAPPPPVNPALARIQAGRSPREMAVWEGGKRPGGPLPLPKPGDPSQVGVQAKTAVGRRGVQAAAPQAPAQAAGAADEAAGQVGGMRDLKQRGLENAQEAIQAERANPVAIPSPTEAIRTAEQGANQMAKGEGVRGLKEMAGGAALQAVGDPAGIGSYKMQKGLRRVVSAAFSAPAVMNRLRNIPEYGRAFARAAGKGSAALEASLFAAAKVDPAVAAEVEALTAEVGAVHQAEEE
jgi:hypothetical protein